MALTDPREIQTALGRPFAPEDLEWRLQMTLEDKMCGLAVPYVTNRAIQSRLDEVVGPENWHNDYKPWHTNGKKESQICGISIYFEGRGWVTKWDGAEDTDIEPIKGGLSDSMKRAAVQWSIGRVLYNMDTVWVDVEKRGRSFVIKKEERSKLNRKYMDMLDSVHQLPSPPTGIQAELPTIPPVGGEVPKKQEVPQPQVVSQPTAPEKNVTEPIPAPALIAEYTVQDFKLKQGLSSVSTSVTLVATDGKKVQAFARGKLENIYSGAQLYNVTLTPRQQNNVVFYVLEHYDIIAPEQRAA